MTGAMSRRKGSRAEAAVVNQLRKWWPNARRNFDSGSAGGGDVTGPAGVSIEVKCVEKLNIWQALEQAARDADPLHLPVVVFKRNGTDWYAALPADELWTLLKLREA